MPAKKNTFSYSLSLSLSHILMHSLPLLISLLAIALKTRKKLSPNILLTFCLFPNPTCFFKPRSELFLCVYCHSCSASLCFFIKEFLHQSLQGGAFVWSFVFLLVNAALLWKSYVGVVESTWLIKNKRNPSLICEKDTIFMFSSGASRLYLFVLQSLPLFWNLF